MKCEQLKNQTQLLSVQSELAVKKSDQLEAVRTTVDDKLTSWASIVEKNSDQPKLTQKELTKVVKSAIKDSDREYQVMMFNVKEEKEDGAFSSQYNEKIALEIMFSTGCVTQTEYSCERLGLPEQGNTRPLEVWMRNLTAAKEVLSKAKRLKDDENYNMVFIKPDRSFEERKAQRKLVQELKQKRNDFPTKQFYISNSKVCSAD